MNPKERVNQLIEVQEIAAEDLPHIKLLQLDNFFTVNDAIEFEPIVNDMFYAWEINSK